MALGDFWARLGGRGGGEQAKEAERLTLPAPPTADDLRAALDRTDASMTGGGVPSVVVARVHRVTSAIRDTIPRLDTLGAGSPLAYSVMSTATDYLPEAVGGYLRLPRRFADTRPVDGGKTSLMVLIDQLDLLGATMDDVFDAVYRDDAIALVAHGRFLAEKFGPPSTPALVVGADVPVPAMPTDEAGTPTSPPSDVALPLAPDQAAAGERPHLPDAEPERDPEPSCEPSPEPEAVPEPEEPAAPGAANPLDLDAPGTPPAAGGVTPLRPPDPA